MMLLSLFAAFSKRMIVSIKEVMKKKVIPTVEERKKKQPYVLRSSYVILAS
jgi:hypothetical protein